MTGKIKSEENKNTKKANSNFLKIFALIFGLAIVAIVVLVKYNPQFFDSFLKEKKPHTEQILVQDSVVDKAASEDNYSPGPEAPLPSFSPDANELDEDSGDITSSEDTEQEAIHPYEIEVEKDELAKKNIDSPEKQVLLISELNNYRLFLANAQRLITKFTQDQVFYNELRFFNSIKHPNMVKNTLLLLDDYNRILSNPECKETDKFVEIFSSKPLNKFVKVTKISKAREEQKQLKDGIVENLPVLIDYMYSSELQGNFVK